MYGKFFASTFTGSMCGAGVDVFAVWGYVIANTVQSQVELNPKLLAAVLGSTEERVANAISFLCAPDPNSRSKNENGCRLVKEGQFAYFVPNHETYRRIANEEERREYLRVAKQKSRSKQKVNQDVNNGQSPSTKSTHTEAEAEANTIKPLSSEPQSISSELELSSPKAKETPDPRFKLAVAAIKSYWDSVNPDRPFVFGPQDGNQLKNFLRDCRQLTIEQFEFCLSQRAQSQVVHTERPSKWIGSLMDFANGPLDKFRKPLAAK